MTPEFAYLLKVNVAFVLFYAFYRLFFYKDTFFKLRRAILLAFFGLALFYPLLNIQDWVRQQEPIADVIYMRRRRKRMPRRPWIGMDGCWDLWGLFIGGS